MSNQMKDFLNWLSDEAPDWVRYVAVILFIFLLSWALVLLGVLVAWAGRNGYWGLFALPPVVAIWAILRAYQKWRGEQDE
jgi:hypothetical protein